MNNTIDISVSFAQIFLAFAFQVWIIVFPIILIRKLNYLTALIASQGYDENESGDSEAA